MDIVFPLEGMRRPLVEWRRTGECLRPKQRLFGQSMDVSGGGYLPGYLALRNI